MNPLETLRQYFPTGTTEGERHLLDKVFVYDSPFAKATAPSYGSPRLLVGMKGTGKTALVEYLERSLARDGVPVALLRPDDFDLTALGSAMELGAIKRASFTYLTFALAGRLSASGQLAHGHKQVLNVAARAYEKGNLDSVQKLLKILLPVGKAITDIDFAAMLPETAPHPSRVAEAIRSELGQTDRLAYLMVDDTDQIGAPAERNYLARIWGLLLGIRELASKCPNLKCIVTLRTEVWRRLQWDERGQRDQVDHFRPLVVDWAPSSSQLRAILDRRLHLAAPDRADPKEFFFKSKEVDLPDSDEHRLWADFLVKNSRDRPRDLVQLLGKCIDAAQAQKDERIDSRHLRSVIGAYSAERVDYLADEFAQDCSSLREILRSLARLENVADTNAVLAHLRGLPSAFRIEIRGKTLQGDERSDALVLWKLLHESGVLNALVADRRENRGFRHINHSDDPSLVSEARWNDMQGMQWEIHPVFRSYLNAIREESAAALGISARDLRNARRPRT